MAAKISRKRKPNFTINELEVLLKGVETNRDILMGKFSDTITNDREKKIWRAIAAEVSAESSTQRSDEDVKKKWHDWSSIVKGKQAKATRERKKTGGGPPPENDDLSLSALEERVLGILGTTCVYGLDADFGDTFVDTDSQELDRNIRSLECDEDLELESDDSVQIHVCDDNDDDTPINVSPTCSMSTQNNVSPTCSMSRPSEVRNETSRSYPSGKKRKRVNVQLPVNSTTNTHDIYQVEERKLTVEETRLTIERDRLDIEKQRLNIEKEILMTLKEFRPTRKGPSTSPLVNLDEARHSSRHSSNPMSTFPYYMCQQMNTTTHLQIFSPT